MQYTVIGNVNQCVVARMGHGDELRAEIAELVLLSDGVSLEAATHEAGPSTSKVAVLGETVPLTHFRCMSSLGVATFAARCCGEPRQLELHGGAWMCARDAF